MVLQFSAPSFRGIPNVGLIWTWVFFLSEKKLWVLFLGENIFSFTYFFGSPGICGSHFGDLTNPPSALKEAWTPPQGRGGRLERPCPWADVSLFICCTDPLALWPRGRSIVSREPMHALHRLALNRGCPRRFLILGGGGWSFHRWSWSCRNGRIFLGHGCCWAPRTPALPKEDR